MQCSWHSTHLGPLEYVTYSQCYGSLPSRRASLPFDYRYQIILLGEQRHMCVNNLLKVVRPIMSRKKIISKTFVVI